MIQMTGHRVLVDADSVDTEVDFGEAGQFQIVTDEKLERTGVQRGVIVNLGPDCWKAYRYVDGDGIERNGEAWAKVGDYILFSRHAGRFVEDPMDENKLYLVMNDEDILGVFHEGKNAIPENGLRDQLFPTSGDA